MIEYRTFRNNDPPLIADVWNASLSGNRTVSIQSRATSILEYFILAKPYFDPAGLILALDQKRPVGFVHCGFAGSVDGRQLDYSTGILCSLGVIPSHRRKGIGSELLRRAEGYFRGKGARIVVAGPATPNNPFTFGLYGGSNSVGFLDSNSMAQPFFTHRGYQLRASMGIFQRSLKRVSLPTDPRFLDINYACEIVGAPLPTTSWYSESVLGPIEAVEYRLREKGQQEVLARISLWDMHTLSFTWNATVVGLLHLEVDPQRRARGLGKYLLSQVLMHLHQQSFDLFEVSTSLDNPAMLGLLNRLGFEQTETGHTFSRSLDKA